MWAAVVQFFTTSTLIQHTCINHYQCEGISTDCWKLFVYHIISTVTVAYFNIKISCYSNTNLFQNGFIFSHNNNFLWFNHEFSTWEYMVYQTHSWTLKQKVFLLLSKYCIFLYYWYVIPWNFTIMHSHHSKSVYVKVIISKVNK